MQKNILHLCAASLIFCAGAPLNAAAAEASDLTKAPIRPEYRPWTVGVEAGTTGLGAYGSWRFSDHLGVRLGGDYLEYSEKGTELKGVRYDLSTRLLSEPLTLDVYPWEKHSFHVSVGMMFNQNQLSGTATDHASLTMKIEQQPVNPYLSIGGNFFYLDHAHRWAVGGELGVAYTGNADVSLNWAGRGASAIDGFLQDHKNKLQDYADQLMFYPVVKLQVSYSF